MSVTSSVEESRARPCYEQLPIICFYSYKELDKPVRDPTSKWFISNESYSGKYWPAYCRGGLYMMPTSLVTRLYQVSSQVSLIHLDDVLVTGLMRQKLEDGVTKIFPAPYSQQSDFQLYTRFFGGDDLEKVFIRHLWGNIKNRKVDIEQEMIKGWERISEEESWKSQGCY